MNPFLQAAHDAGSVKALDEAGVKTAISTAGLRQAANLVGRGAMGAGAGAMAGSAGSGLVDGSWRDEWRPEDASARRTAGGLGGALMGGIGGAMMMSPQKLLSLKKLLQASGAVGAAGLGGAAAAGLQQRSNESGDETEWDLIKDHYRQRLFGRDGTRAHGVSDVGDWFEDRAQGKEMNFGIEDALDRLGGSVGRGLEYVGEGAQRLARPVYDPIADIARHSAEESRMGPERTSVRGGGRRIKFYED